MSLENTVEPSFGPVVATPAGNTEQRPSSASTPTFGNGTGSPSSQSLSTDEALSKELDSQSVNAPGISASDAMDLDPPSSSSFSAAAQAPRNVDPQVRIDELTLAIDNHIIEVAVISDTVLLERDDDARANALHRMEQLNQSIRSLVAIKDCLVSSLAATRRLTLPSPAVPVLPSSVDGGQRSNSHRAPPVVPNNLPAFQWVGMDVFEPKSHVFPSVDACLLKFQDVMFEYRMNFDEEYARLVPPMLSPEQRTWYTSFTSSSPVPATWSQFKSAIKARYGVAVMEERNCCAFELMNICVMPGESVPSFIDRFMELLHWSQDQAPTAYLSSQLFLNALPWALKYKINTIRQSQGTLNVHNIEAIVKIARESLTTMSASELAVDSVPAFERTAAGSNASQWASYAALNASASFPAMTTGSTSRASSAASLPSRRAGVAAGRVAKSHPKATKSCIFHQGTPHNHDTSECKQAVKLADEQHRKGRGNGHISSDRNEQQSSSGKRFMMSLAEAKASDRCRICGAHNYSAGPHECNTAIRTGDAPTSTLHRFGMMQIHEDVASSPAVAATADVSNVVAISPPPPATEPILRSLSLSSGNARSCMYHGDRANHSTEECIKLRQLVEKKRPRGGRRAASSSSTAVHAASPLPPPPQPAAVADPVAVQAPSVSASKVQSSDIVNEHAGSSFSAVSPAAVPSQDGHSHVDQSVEAEPMDIDVHATMLAQQCKEKHRSNVPVNKSNSLLIPLAVESHKVYGVLDTGCTFSICSPRFANQLGAQINRSVRGHVQLGHTDSIKPRIGTCSLNVSYNKRSFIHTFEIFDFFTDADECPVLLGLDIMPDLQIGVTGLASTWCEEIGPRLPDPIDPDIEPNNDPFGSPAERANAFKPIELLLKQNAAINLATTHCNLPGAIVQLETIPGKIAYRAPYPIPVVYKEAVSKQLIEWEHDGVIERSPSHNGWNSPLLVVAKKNADGEYTFDKPRIVADVRLLNQILISTDKYIMPRIDEIHARHSRAVITSSIDIKSFFTSFLVNPRHRHKLAFTDPFTQTQWMHRKVCFGINFMGNLSMRLISDLFSDLRDQVSLYIDDLGCLTYTDSLEDHVALVAEVIRRLTKANLQINRDKFVFAQKSSHVLGWSIIQNRLVPDARKLTNFHLWPVPTTGKQVMKYLGFCNYFRNVIPRFSELAAPLDALRNYKSLDGLWTDAHTKAFKSLQAALSSPVALSPVDFRYKLHVATDASATAIGGIIYYIKQGVVHYVVMASRKLSPSEMAYSTTKRELLAIVYMLTKYHKWLFGIEFVLHTDHRSLIWLQTQTTPNMMLLTWYEKLFFDYKYELVHIPGTRNLLPDALSRLYTPDDDADGADKLGGGNRLNNKSIMVKEKKRKSATTESPATQSSLAKLNPANRMQFKRKPKYKNNM